MSRIASDLRALGAKLFACEGPTLLRGAVPFFGGIEGLSDSFLIVEDLAVLEEDRGCKFVDGRPGSMPNPSVT